MSIIRPVTRSIVCSITTKITEPGVGSGATVPDAPTIGAVTPGNTSAQVAFTPPGNDGGSAITGYTVTSSPGGITASGSASPITVTGLSNGTRYTFTVHATNDEGDSDESAASDSIVTGPVNLIWEGDSISAGTVGITDGRSYANQYGVSSNLSVANSTITGSAPSLAARAATVDGLMQSGAHNVLIVMTGNDMLGAGTASDETTRLATYLDDRATAAATAGKLLSRIVIDSPPRTSSGFNAKRATANATKATWVGSHCEYYISLAGSGMGDDADASDAAKYSDGVHPTAAGHTLLLAAIKPTLDALLPSLSGAPQTDLIEHWKLGYGLTQAGGKASAWRGQRRGFSLAQGTGGSQPAVQGDSSLLFDGSDDSLAATFGMQMPGITVCLLMKQVTWTSARCICTTAAGYNSLFQYVTTPGILAHTSAESSTQDNNLAVNTWATVIYSMTQGSWLTQVDANTATTYAGGALESMGGFILGSGIGGFRANIQVKEVLIYRGVLDSTARAAVRTYFATVA